MRRLSKMILSTGYLKSSPPQLPFQLSLLIWSKYFHTSPFWAQILTLYVLPGVKREVVGGYLHGIPLWRVGPDWEVKSGGRRRRVHLHVITIACVRPYITGCRRPWLETDAQFTVEKDIRRKKEACWTSDKSVLGLDQDLHTKSYFLKFVTFFTHTHKTRNPFFSSLLTLWINAS